MKPEKSIDPNRIRKSDLFNVLFRSFFIQGTWNFERMQGLGLCFSLLPVARRLYNDKASIKSFLERHLDFFNAHPYMSTFALGAITKLEEQAIFKKWDDTRPVSVFKERLCSPLGAIGDMLFWKLLKPLSAILGILISLFWGWAGILFTFVFYNFFHIYTRFTGVFQGYQKGFDIIRDLSVSNTLKFSTSIFSIMNFITGSAIIIIGYWSTTNSMELKGAFVFVIIFFVSLALSAQKRKSIEMNVILTISISIIIGLII